MSIKIKNKFIIGLLTISTLLSAYGCGTSKKVQPSPTPIPTQTPIPTPTPTPEPDLDALEVLLNQKLSELGEEWSLYFEDMNTHKVISINSHQVYSASLIKLFVACAVYQKMSEGTLADTDKVANYMYSMITYSDNNAWKALAQIIGGGSYNVGMEYTTRVANAFGFTETGHFMKGPRRNFNYTSVNDVGNYLRMLYYGQIVNEEYSTRIFNLMKQQQVVHKIPSGIPEGVIVANKTGELDYMQGDAALVFSPHGDYSLVIIGNEIKNESVSVFTDLSSTIYNFLNP